MNESILFIPKPGLSFMIVIYGAKTKFYINKRYGRLMNDMEKKLIHITYKVLLNERQVGKNKALIREQ